MDEFYEVAFKRECRGIFRDTEGADIDVGDFVVVESERGKDVGQVAQKGDLTALKGRGGEVGRVVRRATPEDIELLRERRQKEAAALLICRQKVVKHDLKMKPLDVEYEYDGSRITFYFTANGRIDFRELVRDLAHTYRTRIELRQIGLRQETRRMGCYGICGRPLCCSSFIRKFSPVPFQAALNQSLSLNVSKLTGVCGQLKCCLSYEQEFYKEASERFPRTGCTLCCRDRLCRVEKNDIFHDVVQVRREDGALEDLPLTEVQQVQSSRVGLPGDSPSVSNGGEDLLSI